MRSGGASAFISGAEIERREAKNSVQPRRRCGAVDTESGKYALRESGTYHRQKRSERVPARIARIPDPEMLVLIMAFRTKPT